MEDLDPVVLIALKTFGTNDGDLEKMGASAGVYDAVASYREKGLRPTVWIVKITGREGAICVLTVAKPGDHPQLVCWKNDANHMEEMQDSKRLKMTLHADLYTARKSEICRDETAEYALRVSIFGPLSLVLLLGILCAVTMKFSGHDEEAIQRIAIWGAATAAVLIFLTLVPLKMTLVNWFVTRQHLDKFWAKDKKALVIDALAEKPAA